ncbi:MAG: repeat protein [Frankiales bacterium]|nr:repeat protein [Frankiales bacterium]
MIMTTAVHDDLQQLRAATDRLCTALNEGALGGLDSAGVLDVVSQLEVIRRKLETADYELLPELNRRAIPETHATRSVRDFLVQYLRLSPRQATARVKAADVLGPRIAITGERLPATLEATSAARRAGKISTEHAATIADSMHKMPSTVPVDTFDRAEAFLAEQARRFDPGTLRNIARQQTRHHRPRRRRTRRARPSPPPPADLRRHRGRDGLHLRRSGRRDHRPSPDRAARPGRTPAHRRDRPRYPQRRPTPARRLPRTAQTGPARRGATALERHQVIPWTTSQRTRLDELCLECD